MNKELSESINDWALLQGLSDEEVQKIVDASVKRVYQSGDALCKQGETGESMFMILFGRVRMSVTRDGGQIQNLNVLQQGDHFGELTLLIGGARTATAVAMMDTAVLEITREDFYQLLNEVPKFVINLSRTIGGWLRGELSGKVSRNKLGLIGLIRTTPVTDTFAMQIAEWFTQQNKSVEIFTDRVERWQQSGLKGVHQLPGVDEQSASNALPVALTDAADNCDHLIIDLEDTGVAAKLLTQCERIWWLSEQGSNQTFPMADRLSKLIREEPTLSRRTQIVWIQPAEELLRPNSTHEVETIHDDLRCQFDPKTGKLHRGDLATLYHAAVGVHPGLALGGGGARGLAHIGVLAALEENDIYFDRIAGTSAGAIIAAAHAGGLSNSGMIELFNKEMTPPSWVKMIPRGTKWHLMSLFRFGLIEQRFRRHLHDYTFDQLLLPIHMVSVDLITGDEVVRSEGDVVGCMLESINHPIFGMPIFRDGQALVDGGVLNNVPNSVLRQHHCDYVVSVDVGTKLSANFGKNNSSMKQDEMSKVGYFATLNRVLDVSHRGLGKLHASESDFFIVPDTSECPFEDFTQGEKLFDIGYKAAMEIMTDLKEKYHAFVEQA